MGHLRGDPLPAPQGTPSPQPRLHPSLSVPSCPQCPHPPSFPAVPSRIPLPRPWRLPSPFTSSRPPFQCPPVLCFLGPSQHLPMSLILPPFPSFPPYPFPAPPLSPFPVIPYVLSPQAAVPGAALPSLCTFLLFTFPYLSTCILLPPSRSDNPPLPSASSPPFSHPVYAWTKTGETSPLLLPATAHRTIRLGSIQRS